MMQVAEHCGLKYMVQVAEHYCVSVTLMNIHLGSSVEVKVCDAGCRTLLYVSYTDEHLPRKYDGGQST